MSVFRERMFPLVTYHWKPEIPVVKSNVSGLSFSEASENVSCDLRRCNSVFFFLSPV